MSGPDTRSPMELIAALAVLAGAAAPVIYAATVVAGGASIPGYDHIRDSISSLTEAGRENTLWVQCGFLLYNALIGVFALGSLSNLGLRRPWQTVFALYLLTALCGLLMWPFAQDPPGTPATMVGATHIGLAAVESLSTIAILSISVWQLSRAGARSLAIICGVCLVTTTSFGIAAAIATGAQLPDMGLFERITIGSFELWTMVLALVQLDRPALLARDARKS